MDFSHFDITTPDGHVIGSVDGHDGAHDILGADGQLIAHEQHLPFLDQLLDAQGHEIASIDHSGAIWQDGHIVANVHHQDGSDLTSIDSATGHPELTIQTHDNGSASVTTPAGIALVNLQKFG